MKNDIFTNAEKELLEKLGGCVLFQPGQLIYMEGDTADNIYYIRKGRVRVFQSIASGREVTLDVVGEGNIIGESAFVEGRTRPTCIQAVNQVQMISIRISDLLSYFKEDPMLALHFLQQYSDTIDRLSYRLQEQCLLNRYGKVASFLLDLTVVDSPERGTVGGIIPYTHEHMADSLGLRRATVTTVLRDFEEKGWIQSGYGQVKILNRDALENFVEEQKNG